MKREYYKREKYLSIVRPFYDDTETIKVFTGVRRCGKSTLMEIVQDELVERGIEERNIIYLNLDKKEYIDITAKEALRDLIEEKTEEISGVKYLFIDEIQNVSDFELVVNAYREEREFSIFITGSNSYLLSGDLATKLTGRYIEIEMTTLTFDEYIAFKKFLGKPMLQSMEEELNAYIMEGGFPQSVKYDDFNAKRLYVDSVIKEIYEKDIKSNKKIRRTRLFSEIQKFIINNFGQPISVESLSLHLKSVMRENVRKETVYRYIGILEKAKIITCCKRFDLKSKRSLCGSEKYYLSDLSFYFLTNTDNRIPYGPVLENIVFQYARSLGYSASIGKIGKAEVDFILRSPTLDYSYVQVSMTIMNEETEEREYRSLEAIKDNYPKYLLTLDHLLQKRNGIIHKNLADFICNTERF